MKLRVLKPLVSGPVAANPGCVAPTQVGIPTMRFNLCAFVAAPGQFGNVGRDNLLGPGYINVDFSALKDIGWKEQRRIQLRAEVFNPFNHPNFDLPNHNFDSIGQRLRSPFSAPYPVGREADSLRAN